MIKGTLANVNIPVSFSLENSTPLYLNKSNFKKITLIISGLGIDALFEPEIALSVGQASAESPTPAYRSFL